MWHENDAQRTVAREMAYDMYRVVNIKAHNGVGGA